MADINYSWLEIEIIIAKMARHIEESQRFFSGVIGVARGGVIPATLLAGALGLRNFNTIQCVKYTDRQHDEGVRFRPDLSHLHRGTYLVVDDIVDTGDTIKAIEDTRLDTRRNEIQFVYASVIAFENYCGPMVPFVGRFHSIGSGWVVFPWEVNRKAEK